MRFPITDKALKGAIKRYHKSRSIRYGESNGFDPFNPGHVSRVLGVAIESQISAHLFGQESGYTEAGADTDGGYDLEVAGIKWDVKANNIQNENSWLVAADKKEGDSRPDDTHFLCVNGVLDADHPNNRSFEIVGWTSMLDLRQNVKVKWYNFGPYFKITPDDLQSFNDFSTLRF